MLLQPFQLFIKAFLNKYYFELLNVLDKDRKTIEILIIPSYWRNREIKAKGRKKINKLYKSGYRLSYYVRNFNSYAILGTERLQKSYKKNISEAE